MIGFHQHWSGSAFNIEKIRSISPPQKGKPRASHVAADIQFLRIDGEEGSREILASEVEVIMHRPAQLMPAEACTQLLYVGHDDKDGVYIHGTLLIAWALCLDGEIRPVTPAGVNDAASEPQFGWYIKAPDGRVYGLGIDAEEFDDVETFKVSFAARMKRGGSE